MERYLWLYLFLQHAMMATNKMHRKIPTEQVCVNPASRLRALSYKAAPPALVGLNAAPPPLSLHTVHSAYQLRHALMHKQITYEFFHPV